MSTKHAVHLATCVAAIAFVLAFALPAFVPIPVLWYWPVERAWGLGVKASGIAIDFYGKCLFATAVASAAALATYAFARRCVRREPSGRVVALFTVWAISLALLVVTFYAWRLAHRLPAPPPIPSWYQPR